jgi:hypothetical protein
MTVTLRNSRDAEDIRLQNAFWVQVTRDLPWCWKATISPFLYSQGAQFDPRSRCFAFEGDRLVGYMSFTGRQSLFRSVTPGCFQDMKGSCKRNSMTPFMVSPPAQNMAVGRLRSVSESNGAIKSPSSSDMDSWYSVWTPSMFWIFAQSQPPRSNQGAR